MKKTCLVLLLVIMVTATLLLSACIFHTEHTWDDGTITTQPTCQSEGVRTYSCTFCYATKTEPIPRKEHTFEYNWTSDSQYHWHAPTCNCTDNVQDKGEHNWDMGEVTVPATCQQTGVFTQWCLVCFAQRQEEIPVTEHGFSTEWTHDENSHWHAPTCSCPDNKKDQADHTWDEGRVLKEPNCFQTGRIVYVCTECNREKGEDIPKTQHTFSDEWSFSDTAHWHAATCMCTNDKSDIGDHIWSDGVVTTPPTCSLTGVLTYTCTICPATKTEVIPTNDSHNWSNDVQVFEPTCTAEGYTLLTCLDCGETGKDAIVPKLDHSYQTVVTKPTCTAEGYTTYTCTVCGETHNADFVEILPHSYTDIVTPPTCVSSGYTTHWCYVCGDEYDDNYVKPLGHIDTAVVTAPTCQEEGYTTHSCSRCNYVYKDTYTDKVACDYQAVVYPPSCTLAGYTMHTCWMCGDSYRDGHVPMLSHDYQETSVTAPTCTAEGFTTKTCTGCGKEQKVNFVERLPHNYVNIVCTQCGDHEYSIGLSYTLSADGTYYTINGMGSCNDTELVIPHTHQGIPVTQIAPSAFADNANIVSVEFLQGEHLLAIGEDAFAGCTNIGGVYIYDISNWCGYTFGNAHANPLAYGHTLYIDGSAEVEELILDGMTAISAYAFYGYTNCDVIRVKSSVTEMGFASFAESGFEEMYLPFVGQRLDGTGATHLGYIFGAVDYQTQGDIVPETLDKVAVNNATVIAPYALYGCKRISRVDILPTVTSMGVSCLEGCSEVDMLSLPFVGQNADGSGATHFGYIFGAPDYQTQSNYIPSKTMILHIKGGVKVGDYAFYGCANIDTLSLPATITSIGEGIVAGCNKLALLYMHSDNTVYHSKNDCIIHTADKKLVAGCKDSSIPTDGSVTSIASYAFYNCTSLTTITIPQSVTFIYRYAFKGCTGLQTVTFVNTVGWKTRNTEDDKSFSSSQYVSNPEWNANELVNVYEDKYWYNKSE